MDATSDTTKILEKGPEYLRKQMELESETKGRMSAVERLAASKLKYVKSQQVVNSTQEPVISFGSPSVSSTGSSNRSSNRSGKLVTGSNSTKAACGAQNCSPGQKNVPLPETADKEGEAEQKIATPEGTVKECSLRVGASGTNLTAGVGNKSAGLLKVPEFERRCGKGVSRSHSDISSRYSKNFADFDSFFMYCGLDGEVIESLGKENFSARSDEVAINIRSASVSTSDDGFSRNSGDSDGLLEDELHGKINQGTSVIERNARIIKWLYSCKNAKESGKKLRDLD
ncbi:protein FAM110B [Larimichthys crocea]|uniref:protein FAM110B n=1 Tax=Larimichthys crocea TaxID=215358 RepID=UPI000F5EF9DA|nr:protein FAM110C [Larimichthys crocea]